MYPLPLHLALASTSRGSSDIDVEMAVVDTLKADPDNLLTPTDAIRVIQLVEMPAPPRRMPPSSASASSSSASTSDINSDDEDQEDDDAASYCSSAADGDEEEEIQAREAEASKVTRILAWRAQFAVPSPPTVPTTPSVPTTPPSLRLSPSTPAPPTPRPVSRKRSAASSVSSVSAPRSKRSRTSSVSMRATAAPSTRFESETTKTGLFLAPPSPTNLARRHTSPRHHHSASLPVNALSAGPSEPSHHRAPSLSLPLSLDTVCPACDRRFSTKRAFRVHALHSGEGAEDQEAACWAAVSYALEAAAAHAP